MILTSIAKRMATNIKAHVPEHPASIAVLQYGIEAALNVGAVIILTLVSAIALGRTQEVLIAMITFALLRQISGGYHLKSGVLCIIVSTMLLLTLSYASFNGSLGIILNLVSLVLVLVYSPSNIEKQTRINPRYFIHLKVASALLIVTAGVIGNSIITMSFFVQAVSLIRRRR